MKISFRNVAYALAIVAVLSFGTAYVASGISVCPDAQACMAAVGLSGFDYTMTQPAHGNSFPESTPAINTVHSSSNSVMVPIGAEIVALYCLIAAVIILILMEFARPHFLKKFLRSMSR